jgi:hypothetical protein
LVPIDDRMTLPHQSIATAIVCFEIKGSCCVSTKTDGLFKVQIRSNIGMYFDADKNEHNNSPTKGPSPKGSALRQRLGETNSGIGILQIDIGDFAENVVENINVR